MRATNLESLLRRSTAKPSRRPLLKLRPLPLPRETCRDRVTSRRHRQVSRRRWRILWPLFSSMPSPIPTVTRRCLQCSSNRMRPSRTNTPRRRLRDSLPLAASELPTPAETPLPRRSTRRVAAVPQDAVVPSRVLDKQCAHAQGTSLCLSHLVDPVPGSCRSQYGDCHPFEAAVRESGKTTHWKDMHTEDICYC